ncbi:hypothetical protein [Methylobacterium sp. 37f]|uniref:hypothetical protein n=1 Tax=Methylobacterium sp. 37f TaxID=2817058 RepID=UPI001FFD3ADC|nr:hypothetical protein [Methylobacterium sp. 37f]MCK2053752.1 hypothetical protein [Methylobacterium sp. 37f]
MRVVYALTVAVLAAVPFAVTVALADEALYLTPPLYRDQARALQQTRNLSDLTTTPQPVAASKPMIASRTVRIVADAAANRAD